MRFGSSVRGSQDSVIPTAAQIYHPLPFDLRAVVNQDGSVRGIGRIWDEERLWLEGGGISLSTADSQASDLALEEHVAVILADIPDEVRRAWRQGCRWSNADLLAVQEQSRLGFVVRPGASKDGDEALDLS